MLDSPRACEGLDGVSGRSEADTTEVESSSPPLWLSASKNLPHIGPPLLFWSSLMDSICA